LFNFEIKETVMNKLTFAVLALILAVLGGCAGAGDMIGTGGVGYDTNSPFPREVDIHAGG
jgi:hypothetical protein